MNKNILFAAVCVGVILLAKITNGEADPPVTPSAAKQLADAFPPLSISLKVEEEDGTDSEDSEESEENKADSGVKIKVEIGDKEEKMFQIEEDDEKCKDDGDHSDSYYDVYQ